MSCLKCVRLSVAGVKSFSRPDFLHRNQPFKLSISRSVNSQARFACTYQPLLKDRDQYVDSFIPRSNVKQYSNLADEKNKVVDDTSSKLKAKWIWVKRGKYKVAAFDAEENPALAVESRASQYLHRHICPNCKTTYDHSHPYQSLKHPQYVKDCPQCKAFAPLDKEIK